MKNVSPFKIIIIIILSAGIALGPAILVSKVLPPTNSSKQVENKKVKPLFKDFMGINGHFHFKPELYGQVCRLVRNYHSVKWDVENLGDDITLPVCANQVNWEEHVYAPWKEKGFETDICIQFLGLTPPEPEYKSFWKGQEDWTYRYGKTMASFFGPSGEKKLCTSMEVGNEPGSRFDTTLFKTIFTNMAKGIRDGDPKMKILTPTVQARTGDDYSQDLNSIYKDEDVLPLYDVINLHVYASIPESAPGKSPWNRTFPEDSATDYLQVLDETIEWRNRNAEGKEIWITEFGYDACTPDVMDKRTGWALTLDWQGVNDLQQAQYIIRSFFLFAERDIDRAYIYYYDDANEPSIHAAGGLTRNFQPKISFWAVKQLYSLLGEYRFARVVQQSDDNNNPIYVYEFCHGEQPDKKIWAVWSATGVPSHEKDGYVQKIFTSKLQQLPGKPTEVISMATSEQDENREDVLVWKAEGESIELTVSESPVYIVFE